MKQLLSILVLLLLFSISVLSCKDKEKTVNHDTPKEILENPTSLIKDNYKPGEEWDMVWSDEFEADSILAEVTFRDVTKIISIPATVNGEEIKADFVLDTTDFNMKYAGVNKEVRIEFNIVFSE